MIFYIFRLIDGALLSWTFSQAQSDNEWQAVLNNEEGVADDFIRLRDKGPIPPNYIPKLNKTKTKVVYELSQKAASRNALKATGMSKLEALGLSKDELDALGLGV